MTLTESPSQTVEWYTPQEAIDFVLKVFPGGIDLDPCADMKKRIPARDHYAREDDCTRQGWYGRTVFINPPYGEEIVPIVDHALDQYQNYLNIRAMLWLVPSRTDTAWWHQLTGSASYIAYPRGRYRFLEGDSTGHIFTKEELLERAREKALAKGKPPPKTANNGGKFPLCWVYHAYRQPFLENFERAALDANMRVTRVLT